MSDRTFRNVMRTVATGLGLLAMTFAFVGVWWTAGAILAAACAVLSAAASV